LTRTATAAQNIASEESGIPQGMRAQGENIMRAFVLAVIATALLATGTAYMLERIQKTADVANATSGARITRN
jgi:capsular polysaccharide biosynthesis protein